MTTLEKAKAAFQKADHELQFAWARGDAEGIVKAEKAKKAAYNKVARLVKAQMGR
jgi:hypothetical protein